MKISRFPQYEFLECGLVISHVKKNPKALKPIMMGKYVGLQLLRCDGLREKVYLHRVIAEAFHGPCPEGYECRHLDGDRANNRASNLSWGTREQNTQDRMDHGTSAKGEGNAMSKLTKDQVLKMRSYRKETCESYSKIAIKFGVSTMTAYRAITGKNWSHVK